MLVKLGFKNMKIATKEEIEELGFEVLYLVAEMDEEKTSVEDIEELGKYYDLEVLSY